MTTLNGTQIMSRGLLTNSYNLSCLSPLIENKSAMNTTLCLNYTSNQPVSSTVASVVSTSYENFTISPSQLSVSVTSSSTITDKLSDLNYIEVEQENIINNVRISKLAKSHNNSDYIIFVGERR